MQTTPETTALLAELYERSSIVAELDGPQIEAWVSGLFTLFDDNVTALAFVDYCAEHPSVASMLVCTAIAELSDGIDPDLAQHAGQIASQSQLELPFEAGQIGQSQLFKAWTVQAPFGRSVVLGFDNPIVPPVEETPIAVADVPMAEEEAASPDDETADDATEVAEVIVDGVIKEDDAVDLRHSVLIELGADELVDDVQLAGAPQALVDEAAASDDRVVVAEIDTREAVALVVAAWPGGEGPQERAAVGAGLAANQQFVRRRLYQLTETVFPLVVAPVVVVDVQRGMSDADYQEANRAARSTLQAALGLIDSDGDGASPQHQAWIGVIRGDGGDVLARERDALLWLEWADWLGVGIGLSRAGVGAAVDGPSFVDYVNRCPEVSSTIHKGDRDYAEWAFEVAIDLLDDLGIVADGALTAVGHKTLGPAMVAAWT